MPDTPTDELSDERATLRKADEDIVAGERRLYRQEQLVATLDVDGHDTTEARLLVEALRATLEEWRKHRVLIQQRIIYLTRKDSPDEGEPESKIVGSSPIA